MLGPKCLNLSHHSTKNWRNLDGWISSFLCNYFFKLFVCLVVVSCKPFYSFSFKEWVKEITWIRHWSNHLCYSEDMVRVLVKPSAIFQTAMAGWEKKTHFLGCYFQEDFCHVVKPFPNRHLPKVNASPKWS